MNTQLFYKELHEVEDSLADRYPLVVSLGKSGARAGVATEVSRSVAARMIKAGTARLATDEEKKEYVEANARQQEAAQRQAAMGRVQLTVLTPADMERLRGAEGRKERQG